LQPGYLFVESGILSDDGKCRAFDSRARGTVPGSGIGVVVLKRLEAAQADGDRIHAVIKGSAINNDGAAKVGYTAPSVEGQRRVIELALATAGIQPRQVSYVEAHGTGTALGDPIEVEALRQVFGERGSEGATCGLGSVKTNIGHCDAAAGMAGLIKAVLCLENRTLVPSLHFRQPNPEIDLERSPFFIVTETKSWTQTPRFAGVSSFGIGGTNAHLIVGEAPEPGPTGPSRQWQVLTLSAQTESALQNRKADLARFLTDRPEVALADVAFTANRGRKAFRVRQSIVCANLEEAIERIEAGGRPAQVDSTLRQSLVFLFPGQGKRYTDLGRDLYQQEGRFRLEVDRCCKRLLPLIGEDLRKIIFAKAGAQREQLERPTMWQLAMFVVEYSMARMWMSWGVEPAAMVGHSIGEYVAATIAGVLEVDDALALLVERGRATELLESGAMLAVPVGEDEIRQFVRGGLSLAAVNGPNLCVVSGPIEEIRRLEREVAHHQPILLDVTHAFHSVMVEAMMEGLTRVASRFSLSPPRIPYLSNVTGTWIGVQEATDPGYWARHLRSTVRYWDCLKQATLQKGRLLLEVGPGKVLSDLASRTIPEVPAHSSLNPNCPDGRAIAETICWLWNRGVEVDWNSYYGGEKRARLPLPTYPFERQSYWIASHLERTVKEQTCLTSPEAEDRPNITPIYEGPRNDVEQSLVEIWAAGFGFKTVGIRDSFFELGGHSLLAVELLRVMNNTFATRLGLKDIFDFPTIAALAVLISGNSQDDKDVDSLEAMLEEIEGLSDESVRSALDDLI